MSGAKEGRHIRYLVMASLACRQSLAKIAATTYDAKAGGLVQSTGAQHGTSHKDHWVALHGSSP